MTTEDQTQLNNRPCFSSKFPLSVLILMIALVFSPGLFGSFLNWDDIPQIVENPHLQGLGWQHLRWMWTQSWFGNYHPLTWMSYGLNFALWGPNPFSFHIVNMLLHMANAYLFFKIAEHFLVTEKGENRNGGAAFAAFVFALHPLRVESIAWISARGNLLGSFFFLLTVLCLIRVEIMEGHLRLQRMAFIALFLSLLSKAWAVMLPAVMMVLDGSLFSSRLGDRRPREKFWFWKRRAPLWAMVVPFGVAAAGAKSEIQSLAFSFPDLSLHLGRSAWAVLLYLEKTILPFGFSPLYEPPDPILGTVAGISVFLITLLSVSSSRRWPGFSTAWWIFLLLLIPVTGVWRTGRQFAADRYTYLACLPWAILSGWAWNAGIRAKKWAYIGGLAVYMAILPIQAYRYGATWKTSETLWQRALDEDPQSASACGFLAGALLQQGKEKEALFLYENALRKEPTNPDLLMALGNFHESKNDWKTALHYFTRWVALQPNRGEAQEAFGRIKLKAGDAKGAVSPLVKATSLSPRLWQAHCELGVAYLQLKRFVQAEAALAQAETLFPLSADVQNNSGLAALELNHYEVALAYFHKASDLRPGFFEAQLNMGEAYERLGDLDAARMARQRAAALAPTDDHWRRMAIP